MSIWRNLVKKLMTAMLVMVAAACSFVTVQEDIGSWTTLPTVIRADTREFVSMRYERQVDIIYLWTLSQLALPNEVAFCLYGHAVDTLMTFRTVQGNEEIELNKKVAVVDSVHIANIKSASPRYVEFEGGIACDPNPRLIGTAHTHPNVPHPSFNSGRCTHSDLDVLYAQNRGTEYWLTLVLCEWTHELMWADGRRLEYYVRNPTDPLSSDVQLPPGHPEVPDSTESEN